jgi:hypothetical protein
LKFRRPSGDRVKTGAREAVLLARLLRTDEIVALRILVRLRKRDVIRSGLA